MKDGDVVKIARKIDALKFKIDDLISEITESDHPNAATLTDHLLEECWFPAWATHVIEDYLEAPERWETGNYGIRRKSKDKALS